MKSPAPAPSDAPAAPAEFKLLRPAVCIWVVVTFARPQDLIPVLKFMAPGLLSLTLVIVALFREKPPIMWHDVRVRAAMTFAAVMTTGVLVAVNHYWLLQNFLDFLGYLVVFFFALPPLLNEERSRRLLMNFAITVCCFLAVWCMLHVGHGYSAHTADENDAALFLGLGLAFAGARAMDQSLGAWKRILFTACAILCFAGVIATDSRGGLVGAVSAVVMMLYLSGRMIKGLLTVILIAVLALPLVPDDYFGEMQTMSNQDDGTRRQRLFFWGVAWQEFLSSPIIGVGTGNFSFRIADFQESTPALAAYVAEYQRSFAGRSVHSSYFQIISELGLIGITSFFTMIFSTLLLCRRICRAKISRTPDAKVFAQAIAGAVLSTCAGGAFLSAAMFPNFWMLFAMGAAAAAYCLPPKPVPAPRVRRKQPAAAAAAEATPPAPAAAGEPAAARRAGRPRAAARRT